MSDQILRTRLIRLAHTNPDLRPHLLPLLKTGGSVRFQDISTATKEHGYAVSGTSKDVAYTFLTTFPRAVPQVAAKMRQILHNDPSLDIMMIYVKFAIKQMGLSDEYADVSEKMYGDGDAKRAAVAYLVEFGVPTITP
jgi:hypothetical protein